MFVCVLKSGGSYDKSHVRRLRQHLEHPLICLTDKPLRLRYVEEIPLEYNLSGWWSKLELFRPDILNGSHVYLDLDVDIVGDPQRLYQDTFTMCRDFIKPDIYNSSVMAWNGSKPTSPFTRYNDTVPDQYKRWPKLGDQAFIQDTVDNIQTFSKGLVRSYRKECQGGVPKGTVVVAYHGRPKPWDIE